MAKKPKWNAGKPKSSWREGDKKEKKKERPKSHGGKDWRKTSAKTTTRNYGKLGRLAKRVTAVLGFVLCGGLITFLLILPGCFDTEIVVITQESYDSDAIVPNLFADRDAEELKQLGSDSGLTVDRFQGETSFEERFSKVDQGKTLVVYVNVHGIRNSDGAVLLTSGADPDRPGSRGFLTLESLWKAMEALPEKQRKIVLLNITQLQENWRMGVFANNVLGDWTQLEKRVNKIPHLAVMLSGSPGEKSWSNLHIGSDERSQSVFGYFVVEGLKGHADFDGDDRVKLHELFRYVNAQTRNWVRQNRDPREQHPRLIISDGNKNLQNADIVSVSSGGSSDKTATDAPTTQSAPQNITGLWSDSHKAWKRRETIREKDDVLYRQACKLFPQMWRKLTWQLTEAERQLHAHHAGRAKSLLDKAGRTLDQLEELESSRDGTSASKSLTFVDAAIRWRALGQAAPTATADIVPALPADHLRSMINREKDRLAVMQELETAAIDTRNIAEQAASGPLGTYMWTDALVARGDRNRRIGEDWLFVGNAEQAKENLANARNDYATAIQIAKAVDAADLVLRKLYVELPEIAEFVAGQRLTIKEVAQFAKDYDDLLKASRGGKAVAGDPPIIGDLKKRLAGLSSKSTGIDIRLLILFQRAGNLENLLENIREDESAARQFKRFQADQQADGENTELHALMVEGEKASKLLAEIKRELREAAAQLGGLSTTPQHEHWRSIDELLRCPMLSADVRQKLNDKLREYSKKLNENTTAVKWEDSASRVDEPNQKLQREIGDRMLSRGTWQALWAVQVLSLGSDKKLRDELRDGWSDLRKNKSWDELAALGEVCRSKWRRKRDRVEELLGEEPDSLEGQRNNLRQAVALAATMHGFDAQNLTDSSNPARALRRFQSAELFAAHAERFVDDFWADTEDTPRVQDDWFVLASEQCLKASERLHFPALEARIDDVRKTLKLRREVRLSITPIADIQFGTSDDVPVSVEINGSENLPQGRASVWLSLRPTGQARPRNDDSSRISIKRPNNEDENRPVDVNRLMSVVAFGLHRAGNGICAAGTESLRVPIQPQLLFRGHRYTTKAFTVKPCRPKGTVLAHMPPQPEGQVTVSGYDRRSMLFILDCSFSMDEAVDSAQPDKGSRFVAAKTTLLETLSRIHARNQLQPDKDRIGLMAFGHRVQQLKGQPVKINPNWKGVPPANPKRPFADIQLVADVKSLTDKHYEQLKADFSSLGHWGNTPLLGSIDKACDEFGRLNSAGAIFVVTDGLSGEDANDQAKLTGDITRKLKRFKNVQLYVVGFAVDQAVQAGLSKLATASGGEFINAPSAFDLDKQIRNVMKQREYELRELENSDAKPQAAALDKPVSNLRPGMYRASFPDRGDVEFEIVGGEALVFELGPERIEHVKSLRLRGKSTTVVEGLESPPNKTLHLRYTKFPVPRQNRAVLDLALTNNPDNSQEKPTPTVRTPEEIYFEIYPAEDSSRSKDLKLRSMSWQLISGRGIPRWRVTVQDWTNAEVAEVRAWWKPKRTKPELVIPFADVDAPNTQEKSLPSWEGRQLRVSAKRLPEISDAIEVTVETAVKMKVDPKQDSQFYRELANLRVELSAGVSHTPLNVAWEREFISDEGKVIFTFKNLKGHDIDKLDILITSWSARKKGAFTVDDPPLRCSLTGQF